MKNAQVISIESADESDATASPRPAEGVRRVREGTAPFHAQVEELREAMAGSKPRLSVELVSVDGRLAGCAISYETGRRTFSRIAVHAIRVLAGC